jgi:putative ABC transport system permease protein
VFLSLREVRHSRLRTGLILAVIALVAWLVFLLSGLANGLANDNGASLTKMDASGLVFEQDTRLFLHRSILPIETVEAVRGIEGVTDAIPLGHLTVTITDESGAERVDATVLGIDPTSFLVPDIDSGSTLADAPAGGVVVDEELSRHGFSIGDTFKVTPAGNEFTIVGFTSGEKYNHLPVIFMPLPEWQALKFTSLAESGGIADPISAVAFQGDDNALDAIANSVEGVDVATRQQVIEALPGYSSEMSTVQTILAFLFLIASLVMTDFFYIITLQKTNLFGVLKALGATTRTLALDLIGQVMLLTLIGAAIGAALANLVAAMIPANVPFSLSNDVVIIYGIVLLIVAALGSLLSVLRIARIDPIIAIGRVE